MKALFIVVGLHRSGHHMVCDWIGRQWGAGVGPIRHLENPRLMYWKFTQDRERTPVFYGVEPPVTTPGGMGPGGPGSLIVNPHPVPVSYALDVIAPHPVARAYDRVEVVVVVRSFGNWAASHFTNPGTKARIVQYGPAYEEWQADLWRDHLNALKEDVRFVSFDRFVGSPEHRRRLAASLETLFNADADAAALSRVSRMGGGSTFDALTFDGRAGEMNVLDRMEQARGDEDFDRVMRRWGYMHERGNLLMGV